MAPGLNGRQTGTVPKNKARNNGAQSHRSTREALLNSGSGEWEPVLDQNSRHRTHRKTSSSHSEAEADLTRYDLANSLTPAMSSQLRFEDSVSEGNNQEAPCGRMRAFVPDKKQVLNKITQIQDYIQQTASLMNALKTSDCPEKRKQYEKLSTVLEDLKGSERKLNEMLKKLESVESRDESLAESEVDQGDNNNSDTNDEDLIRRTEEGRKKLELLQKRKQELLELQERARRQLKEAQMEQSRLVARASSLNQDLSSNRFLDLNVQQLSQRLKTTQQLFKTSNQINDALLADNRESNVEEAEHPDEDQIETSDTETDFQIVSDKVAELNMMKAQLSQIQKLMANMSADSSAKDDVSTPTEAVEDRGIQQRSLRNDPTVEGGGNAAKLEQAKVKLNQLTQLLEFAQSAQGSKVTQGFIQVASSQSNDEGAVARRTPSPTLSGKSQTRPGDETYVQTMQNMTKELEERTAAMKEEHLKLILARQELENLAKKIPLVKAERASLSPDDFGSEPACLINTGLDSNGRFMQNEQQSPYNERSIFTCRSVHSSKPRQRGVWSSYVPGTNTGSHDKKCKNEEISRSFHGSENGLARDQSHWSPSPTVSFCDNASCSAVQSQNHVDKSGNMCGRMMNDMLQRTVRPDEITIDELYNQHQILTRTVAQCSHLLWLQQKQIIELRNTLMLHQSAMCQNMCPQPSFPNQSQRNTPLPAHPFQINTLPSVPFPNQMPVQPQEQNFLSPNQSLKLNSGSMPNIQSTQEFADQFYQQGAQSILPFSVPEMLDYQFRYGNFSRSNAPHVNSNSNANQNLNQSGPGLNNRIPLGGITCIGPEDSGALNNQVPPGNRANNYWDNFRSYSRQNLLSHSKSNEDTDSARRTSTASNQERPLRETSSSIMIQNNAPVGPSVDASTPSSAYGVTDASDFDGVQFPQSQASSASRPNPTQVTRPQSVDSQCHRKNESRNHENDSRNVNPKNETGTRSRNPEVTSDSLRSVRNDVGQVCRNPDNMNSGRNFVQLVRDLDNDEGRSVINKKRMDKSRTRNEERGNLNNRSNPGLPVGLRDNLYSEVTNFITANESRPQFLIQLFRDLQKVTTDPLRQRTLESIQETVNVNNLNERSNINGANLNIIDNRNNIRENRSNLNRNQGDDQCIDNFVCQIRENRQNIGNSGGGGNNLENPNISNIRNLGNSRNNLESEGLRDLRTYFEANLCNFGHNSALENPNLSNIRENLTRRGGAGTDLENANPKNLYLSMYDNVWKRNQELVSGQDAVFQNCRVLEQCGNDFSQNGSRGNNPQCSCNNQTLRHCLCDGAYVENAQHPVCPPPERDSKYVNVAREDVSDEEDSEVGNFSNHAKRSFMDSCCPSSITVKKTAGTEDCAEEAGAAAVIPEEWERDGPENRACLTPVNFRSEMESSMSDPCGCCPSGVRPGPQLNNGDLAEADQSRNEEAAGAEASSSFTNIQVPETEDNCSAPSAEAEEGNFCYGQLRRVEAPGCEGSVCDLREVESEGSYLCENSTSESEGTCVRQVDDGGCYSEET